jgi:hypothetical protein
MHQKEGEQPRYSSCVVWNDECTSFIITDTPKFSEVVLKTLYKNSNFNSFVRQLNLYGFSKSNRCYIRQQQDQKTTKEEKLSEPKEYYHPLFMKNRRDLLPGIQRRATQRTKIKKENGTSDSKSNHSSSYTLSSGNSGSNDPSNKRRKSDTATASFVAIDTLDVDDAMSIDMVQSSRGRKTFLGDLDDQQQLIAKNKTLTAKVEALETELDYYKKRCQDFETRQFGVAHDCSRISNASRDQGPAKQETANVAANTSLARRVIDRTIAAIPPFRNRPAETQDITPAYYIEPSNVGYFNRNSHRDINEEDDDSGSEEDERSLSDEDETRLN